MNVILLDELEKVQIDRAGVKKELLAKAMWRLIRIKTMARVVEFGFY